MRDEEVQRKPEKERKREGAIRRQRVNVGERGSHSETESECGRERQRRRQRESCSGWVYLVIHHYHVSAEEVVVRDDACEPLSGRILSVNSDTVAI